MEKRRVLLLCTQPLLGESLEHILSRVKDVELLSTQPPDPAELAHLLREALDIVLIAEEVGESEAVSTLVASILEQRTDLPIVRVGLAENVFRLYTSRTLPARSAELIATICNLPERE